MKKKWRGIDLFCGIGGFRLAMKDAGVECVFSSDNDKFAQETYFANFGEVPQGDIKKIEAKDIPSYLSCVPGSNDRHKAAVPLLYQPAVY